MKKVSFLMYNPPLELSGEDFRDIFNKTGIQPIKYLQRNNSNYPYALICSAALDVAERVCGSGCALRSHWMTFSQLKSTIHDYSLNARGAVLGGIMPPTAAGLLGAFYVQGHT
ncbi:hypothetical protein ACOME3_009043 [Neoechinorhynchus agilis]